MRSWTKWALIIVVAFGAAALGPGTLPQVLGRAVGYVGMVFIVAWAWSVVGAAADRWRSPPDTNS